MDYWINDLQRGSPGKRGRAGKRSVAVVGGDGEEVTRRPGIAGGGNAGTGGPTRNQARRTAVVTGCRADEAGESEIDIVGLRTADSALLDDGILGRDRGGQCGGGQRENEGET